VEYIALIRVFSNSGLQHAYGIWGLTLKTSGTWRRVV